MAKSFISSAAAEGTSLTLSSHAAGDTIGIWAYRGSSTARPVAPAGWKYASVRANVVQAAVFAYKVAASASEVSGTWTNAEMLACVVYRDSVNYLAFGAINPISAAATTNIQYPALVTPAAQTTGLNTMRTAESWVIGAVGGVSIISNIETPPTGMTSRISLAGTVNEIAIHDTNGEVTNWAAAAHTADIATAYQSLCVELFDTGIAKAAAAGGGPLIGGRLVA